MCRLVALAFLAFALTVFAMLLIPWQKGQGKCEKIGGAIVIGCR